MSRSLQLFLLLAIALYFFALIHFVRQRKFELKYMLLWILSGVIMIVLTLFPGILTWVAGLLGVVEPVNALFTIALFCVIIILMAMTAILSHLNARVIRLVQANALLEKRVRELESVADAQGERH